VALLCRAVTREAGSALFGQVRTHTTSTRPIRPMTSAATDSPSLGALERMTSHELEAIYATPRPIAPPTGRYAGRHLCWLATAGAHHPLWRPLEALGFRALPFGIDFDRRLWFFVHARLAMGRFEPRVGRSRWRDTETVQLHYGPSRLPGWLRQQLYDEVKPLADGLCLGLGGINAPAGAGHHFFFALRRLD